VVSQPQAPFTSDGYLCEAHATFWPLRAQRGSMASEALLQWPQPPSATPKIRPDGSCAEFGDTYPRYPNKPDHKSLKERVSCRAASCQLPALPAVVKTNGLGITTSGTQGASNNYILGGTIQKRSFGALHTHLLLPTGQHTTTWAISGADPSPSSLAYNTLTFLRFAHGDFGVRRASLQLFVLSALLGLGGHPLIPSRPR
jgi:hypothetical protein